MADLSVLFQRRKGNSAFPTFAMAVSSPGIRSPSQSGVEIPKVWGNLVGPIVGKAHSCLLVIDSSPRILLVWTGLTLNNPCNFCLRLSPHHPRTRPVFPSDTIRRGHQPGDSDWTLPVVSEGMICSPALSISNAKVFLDCQVKTLSDTSLAAADWN